MGSQLVFELEMDQTLFKSEAFIQEKTTCHSPFIENGQVEGEFNGDMFVGTAKCDPQYELVGKSLIKCQAGIWSAEVPVCTRIGGCDPDDLPEVPNGRKHILRRFRGSVVRYRCLGGFQIYGQSRVHCLGSEWSQTLAPICARRGCDQTQFKEIPHGETKSQMKGAVYLFRCEPGAMLVGSPTLFCDGRHWNDTLPECVIAPEPPLVTITLDGEPVSPQSIEVGQMVTLVCKAQSGHPDPELTFYRNSAQIGVPRKQRNLFKFRAMEGDNNAVFSCTAYNGFSAVSRSDVSLNVNFAPGKVEIQGPSQLVLDQFKEDLTIHCVSAPSNPITRLKFQIQDPNEDMPSIVDPTDGDSDTNLVVDSSSLTEYSGEHGGWVTSVSIILSLEQTLNRKNGLTIDCLGENGVSPRPMEDSLSLTREFPPGKVSVRGPSKMKAVGSAQFSCQSSPAQPAPKLAWRVEMGGKSVAKFNGEHVETKVTSEGLMAATTLTLNVEDLILRLPRQTISSPDLVVECFAAHPSLGEDFIAYAHMVEVLYPPGLPNISGVHSGEQMETGSPRELTCMSKPAGHPPARIQWFMGNQMMESHYSVEGDVALAQVTFVPQIEFNGSELRCEAINEAIGSPVSQTIRLDLTTNQRFIEVTTSTSTTSTSTEATTTTKEEEEEEEEEVEEEVEEEEEEEEEMASPIPIETTTTSTTSTPETSFKFLDRDYTEEDLDSFYGPNHKTDHVGDIYEYLRNPPPIDAVKLNVSYYDDNDEYFYEDDYNYDEENYMYQYPDDLVVPDNLGVHPELIHEDLFKHKVAFSPPTPEPPKPKKTEENSFGRRQNEVYHPKDSPYTASSPPRIKATGLTTIVCFLCILSTVTLVAL
ncbi:hypothetical protein TCAL_08352 [Tigriopus californicus]|uniref:Ig-like domain-containing protein n=1 Tax=Tigriopus californicus TaxID=6832 RepID=A0A553PF91_TIGCA|nr:hypothetical protein TCAL_08352 [Tigriopus californicus]